ncbi:MAG TPA: hypothetical protein VKS60_24300 [Stellaceae bacterium]|nr:hypothetical protein [Stellaceae bacterium]
MSGGFLHVFELRAWRGELGLYRTAYGLGGIGLSLVAVAAELTIDRFAESGRAVWLSTIAAVAGELAFAWFLCVATWRALRRGRPDGRRYGRVGTFFALLFEDSDVGKRRAVVDARVGLISTGDLLRELETAHLIQSSDHILDLAAAQGRNVERQRAAAEDGTTRERLRQQLQRSRDEGLER